MLCLGGQEQSRKKENHITPLGSGFWGELVKGLRVCKLQADPDLVDDSIVFPSELELLHGLAGQRGSEAPQELSDCFPCDARWPCFEGVVSAHIAILSQRMGSTDKLWGLDRSPSPTNSHLREKAKGPFLLVDAVW